MLYSKFDYRHDIYFSVRALKRALKSLEKDDMQGVLDGVNSSLVHLRKYDDNEHYLTKQSISKNTELTEDVVSSLQALNDRLAVIEKGISETLVRTREVIRQQAPKGNFINDYEFMELRIEYYLDKNDPDYNDEDECIIASNNIYLYTQLNDSRNHNDYRHSNHLLKDQHHCYLFYLLYSQTTFLNWGDMLRIGMIWVDINVVLQHCELVDRGFSGQLCHNTHHKLLSTL